MMLLGLSGDKGEGHEVRFVFKRGSWRRLMESAPIDHLFSEYLVLLAGNSLWNTEGQVFQNSWKR